MSPGRRSRSRSRGRRRLPTPVVALAICGVLVVAFVVAPSVAFSGGALDRGSAVDIADDSGGLIGLDVAASVNAGAESRLVTVTNQLDQSLTVDVTSTAPLSNAGATLAPGESVRTTATVACGSAPNDLAFTVQATGGSRFSGVLTRSASVNTAGCSAGGVSFGSVELVDTSSVGGKGKQQAEYSLTYDVEGDTATLDNVTLELRTGGSLVTESDSPATSDTITVAQPGNREGTQYELTVRLFDADGEVESERVVVTDTADGGGTVYQDP